jgi:hypothetical protein
MVLLLSKQFFTVRFYDPFIPEKAVIRNPLETFYVRFSSGYLLVPSFPTGCRISVFIRPNSDYILRIPPYQDTASF